jgi:hypothetical protein
MRFLYWNIHKKDLTAVIVQMAHTYLPDLIILAEAELDTINLQLNINVGQIQKYGILASVNREPLVLSTLPIGKIVDKADVMGISMKLVKPIIGPEFLLCVVHFPSKLYMDSNDQTLFATQAITNILDLESTLQIDKTFLVGDFNMNPFEPGMVGAAAFHSVMSRSIAQKHARIINGVQRQYFYNPMWYHFGDHPDNICGTYYYPNAGQVCYFWNMFDQVLIRPALIKYFNPQSLKILTAIGSESLLNEHGIPNASKYSDHLPIMFDLTIEEGQENG